MLCIVPHGKDFTQTANSCGICFPFSMTSTYTYNVLYTFDYNSFIYLGIRQNQGSLAKISKTTVSWYGSSVPTQFNYSDTVYDYIAIA